MTAKPPVGIEPATIRLRSACSASWAKEATAIFLKLQLIGLSVGFVFFHGALRNFSELQCFKVLQKEPAGWRGKLCPHVCRARIAQPYLAFAARCCVTVEAGSGGERDITVAPGGTSPA